MVISGSKGNAKRLAEQGNMFLRAFSAMRDLDNKPPKAIETSCILLIDHAPDTHIHLTSKRNYVSGR